MTAAYIEDFKSLSSNGASLEPKWLRDVRREGIERFAALGFPTPRNEDWHFTSVAPISEAVFNPLRSEAGRIARSTLDPFTFGQSDWPRLVFVNGRYHVGLSTLNMPGAKEGLRVRDLHTVLHEEPALARAA